MAYYVELTGGDIQAVSILNGGDAQIAAELSGGDVYPSGGGSATLQTKSVSITPTESTQTQQITPDPGFDGLDEVDITTDAIPANYVGSGVPRRDSLDLTTSGATVNVPSGFYEYNSSATIPTAPLPTLSSATIDSIGNLGVTANLSGDGYLQSGTLPLTLTNAFTVQGAQTITPTTTDQTISADQYLTGNQTILGDANLIASNIVSGVTIFGVTGTAQTGGGWVEETISTSGAVTKALDPYTLYHFTGALTSLTITLNAPSAGEIAHYHFDFLSGSTAPTLSLPSSVTMPDSFSVEAGKRYEVDILNNFGTVVEWTS